MSGCEWCRNDEVMLSKTYGSWICADCEEMDRTTDWDEFEARKRERIAEANEY